MNRSNRSSQLAIMASRLLLVTGMLLILAAAAALAYARYAQMRWERAQTALAVQFVPPDVAPISTPAPATPTPTPAVAASATPPALTAVLPVTTSGLSAAQTKPEATPLPTASPSPTATPDDRSDPGRLRIPKIKLNTDIVVIPLVNRQWDVSHILYEAGLLDGTGFPGRPGNAALSGHVSLKGRGDGPFRWLERLAPGDEIIIEQGNVEYVYRVTGRRVVLPTDVSVLAPTETATLTLITCSDWDFFLADYTKRTIVSASLADQRSAVAQ